MGAPPTLGEEIKSSGEITLHSATEVIRYVKNTEKRKTAIVR